MDGILLLAFQVGAFTTEQLSRIAEAAPGMRVVNTRDRAEIEAALNEIEIAVGAFPHDLIASAPNLRWFQQWGAGADWLPQYPEVQESDLILTNASGIHAIPISEHIFAFLLMFARRFTDSMRAQDDRVWIENPWLRAHGTTIRPDERFSIEIGKSDLFELAGKTLLIAGVGAIGARVAKLAKAFDMHVVGMRRQRIGEMVNVDRPITPSQLLENLPGADFVVNTLPMTVETRHLFDGQAFVAMKPSSYYINIGRGGTTDEVALIAALQNGEIAGAGLDVFEREPLPVDSPLWAMRNVIISSHFSGLTPEYDNRALAIFLDNLDRYQHGKRLHNVVDKRLGY